VGKSHLGRLIAVSKFILFLAINSVAFVASATTTTAETLPSAEVFISQLPKYDYACNLQDYFADVGLQTAMHLSHIPSNDLFNAQISKIIPKLLYSSLTRLSVLNPSLAVDIYHNLRREPMRFICSHTISKNSDIAVAYSQKRWIFFGEKTINLGAFVAALIKHDERELLLFNRIFFHEVLHYFVLDWGPLQHAENALHTGGKNDVIYSCSNYVWRPSVPLESITSSDTPAVRAQLSRYYPWSETVTTYTKFMATPNQLKSLETDFQLYPERMLLYVFNYNQCMTCALTHVDGIRIVRSGAAEEVKQADAFCKVIAPKITIRN